MDAMCDRFRGVKLGVFDLDYADDMTLFCCLLVSLEESLRMFNEEATRLGLCVNFSKAKLMHVADAHRHWQ